MLRSGAGWRGRRAAYGTIAGFGLTVIVLIVNLFRTAPPPAASAAMENGPTVDRGSEQARR